MDNFTNITIPPNLWEVYVMINETSTLYEANTGSSIGQGDNDLLINRNTALGISCVCGVVDLYLVSVTIANKYTVWQDSKSCKARVTTVKSRSRRSYDNSSSVKRKSFIVKRKSRRSSSNASLIMGKWEKHTYAALQWCSVLCCIFMLIRNICSAVIVYGDYATHKGFQTALVICHALSMLAIYIFLWLRHRILYLNPAIRLLTSRTVWAISWTIFIVTILGLTATMATFTLVINHEMAAHSHQLTSQLPWILLAGYTSLSQTLMLALYLYPLIKQANTETYKVSKSHLNISAIIKRVAGAALVCMASDITSAIVCILTMDVFVAIIVYDISLIVNLIGLICSFADWKAQLCPLCHCLQESHTNRFIRNEDPHNFYAQQALRMSISSISALNNIDAIIIPA